MCYVCLNIFAERGVEPDNIALPISVGWLCFMRCVFKLLADFSDEDISIIKHAIKSLLF